MTSSHKNDNNDLAIKALESLLASKNLSKKQIYWQNFLRGVFFSLGTIVGVLLVTTVVLWILSLFDSFPFIQHISDTIQKSL